MLDTFLLADYFVLRRWGGMSADQFQTWLLRASYDVVGGDTTLRSQLTTITEQAYADWSSGLLKPQDIQDRLERLSSTAGPLRMKTPKHP
jgi:hypothetical protein